MRNAGLLKWDVLIIGGGAAGLMCAIVAGRRGRRVCVVEHANRVGKKILMSGGGRCNFTNLGVTPENYLSANPHFAKSALARYRSEEHTSELQSRGHLVCRLLLEKKKNRRHCSARGVDLHHGSTRHVGHQDLRWPYHRA